MEIAYDVLLKLLKEDLNDQFERLKALERYYTSYSNYVYIIHEAEINI